jgi:hypothetical protein
MERTSFNPGREGYLNGNPKGRLLPFPATRNSVIYTMCNKLEGEG